MYRFFLIFLFLLEVHVFGQTAITVSPNTENLTLSDIAQSVEYIPLETNENCIIETVGEFTMSDNYILLTNYQFDDNFGIASKVFHYLFARTGQFVTKIDIGEDLFSGDADELASLYTAELFEKNRNNFNKFELQGPAEAIWRMEQLSHTIDTEDNPVLVIVKLK